MASRKEHHFVPRFYLRHFASDEDGKCICLYHFSRNQFIENAPIKHQAKEKLLYGNDDQVETLLGKVEQKAAPVIREVLQTGKIVDNVARDILLGYMLYQERRTIRRARQTKQSMNLLMQGIPGLETYSVSLDLQEMVNMVEDQKPLLQFLHVKVLRNVSSVPFITSDNPVIMYNQMMEMHRSPVAAAWANMGLQVFLPISPEYMLMAYDQFKYTVGKKHSVATPIKVYENDVRQLNALQYIEADQHLYFDNSFAKSEFQFLHSKYASYRQETQAPKSMRLGSFHMVLTPNPRIKLDITCSKLSMNARHFQPTGRLAIYRHPIFSMYKAAQDAKRGMNDEYIEYLTQWLNRKEDIRG